MMFAIRQENDCSAEAASSARPPVPLRLYQRLRGLSFPEALNCVEVNLAETEMNGSAAAAQLKRVMNRLKGEAVDAQTGQVNYQKLRQSQEFAEYLRLASQLRRFDLSSLSTAAEQTAFWINIYNAMVIHAVIAFGVQHSVVERAGFFDHAAYIIGGMRFSADDIEHGILRSNSGHPAIPGPQFARDDPRMQHIQTTLDPRIHFALVCAARSCPPIGVYSADQLDQQLDLATRQFVNHGGAVIFPARRTIKLSRIFSWYAADFGSAWFGYRKQGALAAFVSRYLESEASQALMQISPSQLKIRFQNYDWTLNV